MEDRLPPPPEYMLIQKSEFEEDIDLSDDPDIIFVKRLVSIGISIAFISMIAYFVILYLSGGTILLKPTEYALERQTTYQAMIQHNQISFQGNGVDLCIVDSGIDLSHPDIEQIQLGGWFDFINGQATPYDDNGHGTAMAGIIVAEGWLQGVAPRVNLFVAKALSKSGEGSDETVAEAIDWCVLKGADVISLSLGGAPGILPFTFGGGRSSGDASNDAIDAGIFVVAAAGNDGGENDDGDVAHPSSEELVISVGGVMSNGESWSGSSVGDNNIRSTWPFIPRTDPNKKPEVIAPAHAVPVISLESKWALVDGTSAATAYVSGAIALLLEAKPNLQHESNDGSATVEEVKQWIMDSSAPKSGQSGHDDKYGYGVLKIKNLIDASS
jgi:serine protease AprX